MRETTETTLVGRVMSRLLTWLRQPMSTGLTYYSHTQVQAAEDSQSVYTD
eukprot:c7830_g1_i1 orf=520-669(+)